MVLCSFDTHAVDCCTSFVELIDYASRLIRLAQTKHVGQAFSFDVSNAIILADLVPVT